MVSVSRMVRTSMIPARAATAVLTRNSRFGPSEEATVEAIFRSLSTLKGGPTKLGQVLATFEPAIPPHLVGPYRKALNDLTDSTAPVPLSDMSLSVSQLPASVQVSGPAFAAASIGQVHQGFFSTGSGDVPVAVKLQYPDMDKMLRSDAAQIRMLAYGLRKLTGVDFSELVSAHVEAMLDELDYELEAHTQQRFFDAYSSLPAAAVLVTVPQVRFSSQLSLVTDFHPGVALSRVEPGTPAADRLGTLLLTYTLANPALVGLVHGDPHPGNFLLGADSKLVALDYGAASPASGYTDVFARSALAIAGSDMTSAFHMWRDFGLVSSDTTLEAFVATVPTKPDPLGGSPYDTDGFRFSPEWLGAQASGFYSPSSAADVSVRFALPPDALLEHRALMGTIALLCKLRARVPFNTLLHAYPDPSAMFSVASNFLS